MLLRLSSGIGFAAKPTGRPEMFELPEEHQMLKDLVAKFIDRDVIPLEKGVLAREAAGQKSGPSPDEEDLILAKCKELGLWGLDVPG